MTETNQLTIVKREQEIQDRIEEAQAEQRDLRQQRLQLSLAADIKVAQERKTALDLAGAKVAGLAVGLEAALEHASDLNNRKLSDASVTGFDLTVAAQDVELAKDRLKAGEAEEVSARRDYEMATRDRHLAEFTADLISPVVGGVPVFVHSVATTAPDISPAIILTQTTPTNGYGTSDVSGDLKMTVQGDFDLDRSAIYAALEETGSTATYGGDKISFTEVLFTVPILNEPEPSVLRTISEDIGKAWETSVRYDRALTEDHNGEYLTTGNGYYKPAGFELVEAGDGRATGRLRLLLGTTVTQGDEQIRARVAEVADRVFRAGGDYTSMGLLDASSVTSVKSTYHEWTPGQMRLSGAAAPMSYEVEIEVSAAYEVPVAQHWANN